jgi:diguanylate cyclase (GGDEF)-like protein
LEQGRFWMRGDRWLARVFPRSYRARLLAVMFVCTTLPALLFALWLLANPGADPYEALHAASLTLAALVLGSLVALLLLYRLLKPVRDAADALDAYQRDQVVPEMEAYGSDDMSRLLRGINRCLRRIDAELRELERHACEDTLTGSMNRRGCEQALADSMTLACNGRAPFVLFVLDLDNLKTINDEHGHAAGDRALASLVESARNGCLGAQDWIGRWGGDEFLIGLHDGFDAARERVMRWMRALEATRPDGTVPIFFSAGCAAYHAGMESATLYRQADSAMYKAKFSGGHKLVCHRGGKAARKPPPAAAHAEDAGRARPHDRSQAPVLERVG